MGCCQCQGIEKMFDKKTALKELKRYKKKGHQKTTRMLLKAIQQQGVNGLDFLDIGGGIGAIQNHLLNHGATKGVNIDASKAYLEVAQEESADMGIAEKVIYRHGDFTTTATDSDSADIVTLDKVICCYDDMPALVGLSSRLARKIYGVIYPRDIWWTKIFLPILNLYPRLKGSPFRAFIHPTKKVEDIIFGNGFKPFYYATTIFWQVAVFVR